MQRKQTKVEPNVLWRVFQGTRPEVEQQLSAADLPSAWGAPEVVRRFILEHVPIGDGWVGDIKVTGYRTPANDNGTGTAYVSVHWIPSQRKVHHD